MGECIMIKKLRQPAILTISFFPLPILFYFLSPHPRKISQTIANYLISGNLFCSNSCLQKLKNFFFFAIIYYIFAK